MTKQNAAILSEVSPSATPVKPEPDRQRTLPVGPTGKVVRGGGVPWYKRLALTKAPSPTAHHVLLVLGSFVSDGQSEAWPSVATLASMTGLSHRGVQTALRALEDDHLVQTETVSGRSSRYRLASPPAGGAPLPLQEVHPPPAGGAPLPLQEVHPPPAGGAPEGTREGTSTRKAAAACIRLTDTAAETNTSIEALPQPARHTCPKCGNDWPIRFGTKCYGCGGKRSTALGGSAPTPGKYDGLCGDDEHDPEVVDDDLKDDTPRTARARPDPPPLTPDAVQQLEADAIANGYRKVAGLWTKAW